MRSQNKALFFILFAIVFWSSCKPEKCNDERDDRFGLAVEFADESPCNPEVTLYKFLGRFSMTDVCNFSTNEYELIIESPDLNNYSVEIRNIYNTTGQYILSATVSRNNLTIPEQTVNNAVFSGQAQVSGNVLTGTYQLSNLGSTDECTFTATKL